MKKERQAAIASSFAKLPDVDPTKPPRLPLEIIFHIIDLGASVQELLGDAQLLEQTKFLLMMTKVSSAVGQEASRRLWKIVEIDSDEGAKSYLSGSCHGRITRCLWIGDSSRDRKRGSRRPINYDLVSRVMLAARGLRFLVVKDVGEGDRRVDSSILCSEQFKGGLRCVVSRPSRP